jgi:3-deoxy-D-manno-octulosonic-acid transferase
MKMDVRVFFFSVVSFLQNINKKKNTQLGISYLHNLECYYFLFGFSDKIKIDVIIFNESDWWLMILINGIKKYIDKFIYLDVNCNQPVFNGKT